MTKEVIANIQMRPLKTEVEKGPVPMAVECKSVSLKVQAKAFPKGSGSLSLPETGKMKKR